MSSRLQSPRRIERVFEVRYERGYRYLDRCGEAMVILEELLSHTTGKVWMPGDMQPKGAVLKCPELDITVSLDSTKLLVDNQLSEEVCDFRAICADVVKTVKVEFKFGAYLRWGMRRLDIIGTDSSDEADALSVKASPARSWLPLEQTTMSLRQSSLTLAYETQDRGRGLCLRLHPARKVDAPLEVDERLRSPAHLLPKGQHEALVAQLRSRKKRQEDPDAGVVVDRDYYWVKPEDPTVEAFFPEAESEIDRALDLVLEKLR